MSPRGGIKPHKRFSIQSNRAEVLFVDYIMEHLTPKGRSGIVVPEGIIFQTGTSYKSLRKSLVEKYLVGVISLPSGVFQPYSGVKTSILILDKELSQKTDKIFFGKVDNDGFDLGAQRREIEKNDLPIITKEVTEYLEGLKNGKIVDSEKLTYVLKEQILGSSDIGLSYERYEEKKITNYKWEKYKIKELVKLSSGKGLVKKDMIGGEYLVYGGNGINGTHNEYMLNDSTIVIGRVGEYCGSIHITKPKSWITDNGLYISEISSKINLSFLSYQLKKINLNQFSKTGGQPSISQSSILELEIPLPPIEVQEEIVRELEQYQNVIDGAKQVVDNYKPVIDIDPSWEMKELGEVSIVTSGYSFKSGDFSPNGEVKSIKITNVGVNQFIEDENEYLPKSFLQKHKNFIVYEGDIVIALTRPVISNGLKITITPSNYNESLLNQRVSSIRSVNEIVSQLFIYYILNDKTFIDYVEEKSKSLMQPNLSINDLKMFLVPIPPLEIQQTIVERIESERKIIEGNKKIIEIYTQKIQDRINKIWGE